MKSLPLLLAVALSIAATAHGSDEPAGDKRPGFFSRLNPFRKSAPAERAPAARGSWRRLTLTMLLEPLPLKVSETRQLKVTLTLVNRSSKFVQLEFPTTQRIEVLVKQNNGKLVEQWSEDHAFSNDPGMVSINPGERVVYSANVATRDMNPGEQYLIEAFFPNYEGLRVQRAIVPEK